MRVVGTGTQEAIDTQHFTREVILSVYDEADTPVETSIPSEALIEIPRVQATLDQVTWRMTAQIVTEAVPAGLLLRGRRIVAREWMADGEGMLLFDGHIADVQPSKDWSSGVYRESLTIECAGRLAKHLDTMLSRYVKDLNGYRDDGGFRLTGIVKRMRTGDIETPLAINTPVNLPCYSMPFFGSVPIRLWVKVYDNNGAEIPQENYWVDRDAASGLFTIEFYTLPSTSYFYADLLFVDCWVILNRRAGVWLNDVPYYYILAGTEGIGSFERLNDPATTEVTAVTSTIDFTVADPEGIFASQQTSTYWLFQTRFISVWHNGTEYRGKVLTVDKDTESVTYGRITLEAAPIDTIGTAITTISVGDRVENTTTQHYQVINPFLEAKECAYDGTYTYNYQSQLIPQYNGGKFFYSRKGLHDSGKPINVIPGCLQDLTPSVKEWQLLTFVRVLDDPSQTSTSDAVQYFVSTYDGILKIAGLPTTDMVYENTGLYLTPFSRTWARVGELVDEIRQSILPPNFRIFEEVGAADTWKTNLKYVTQKDSPDLVISGIKSIQPRELPNPITRCLVIGESGEINRAAQLLSQTTGINNPERLFQTGHDDLASCATLSGVNDSSTATVTFLIPAAEIGRYPVAKRLVVRVSNRVIVDVYGIYKYLPRSSVQNDAQDKITTHEWNDLSPILGTSGDSVITIRFIGAAGAAIDTIELYIEEASIWDARLTDNTDLAPADGPDGANGFGATWNRPDKAKFESYRYAPTAWLRRNAPLWTTTSKANRIKVVELAGLPQRQAQDLAQSWCDYSIRSYEFEEITLGYYDPRIQLGDTIGYYDEAGTLQKRLVWGLNKGPRDTVITAADYSR